MLSGGVQNRSCPSITFRKMFMSQELCPQSIGACADIWLDQIQHTFTLQPLCRPQAQLSSWGQRGDFTKKEMASTLALLVLLQLALFSSVTCKKGEIRRCIIWTMLWGAAMLFPLFHKVITCSLSSLRSTSHHRWDWWAGIKACIWGRGSCDPLMWAGVHAFNVKPSENNVHRHGRVDTVRSGLFA